MTPLHHFYYSALITSITTLLLGVFAYVARGKSNATRAFALYSLSISAWSICVYYHGSAQTATESLFWGKALNLGAITIPVLFYHFVLIYLQRFHERSKQILLGICYLFWFVFQGLNFTNLFVPAVRVAPPLHYLMVAGPAYHFFVTFFFILTIYSISLLLKALRGSHGIRRTQLSYFFVSSVFGYIGGVNNFLILYDLHLRLIFPYGSYAVAIYVAVATFIILKYRFMDIEVVIKNTLVFAGLLAFIFGVFTAATFLVREVLSVYFGINYRWSYVLSIFLTVLGYDPIRRVLMNLTDRYLFQKKYDYQKLLKDASRGMSRIESLDHLMRLVIHFVTMKIRVKNAAAVLWEEETGTYAMTYSRGYGEESQKSKISATKLADPSEPFGGKSQNSLSEQPSRHPDISRASFIPEESFGRKSQNFIMVKSHPLIQYLDQEKEALDIEKLKEYIETGRGAKKKGDKKERFYDFKIIQEAMENLQAACIVPSFLGKELRSMLVLGEKKSGDVYTDQDLNVLYTLAQESAIAIENARLYDEAINKSRELEKINKQLEEASHRLIVALSEAEDANKRLLDTQAQLIHEQKMATLGRLAASVGHEVNNPLTILSMNVSRMILKYRKEPNIKVQEVAEYFEKMESNIQRIKAVVNTLTGLLKKSEKGKFEPLSLKLVIEETLPLVQFQTYLDNLTGTEVEFDIPANTPLIKGDLERLQEVFLNLFTNAYHALAGRKDRRIEVSARVEEANPRFVTIDFADNGCGMDDETAMKIFSYGFTTKGEGKGSGIGLYMCRYIIEIHGGEIKVSSKPGAGTRFTLTLPIYEEQASRMAR